MPDYVTPGVYVQVQPGLPPAIPQPPTAIPAFVGYTEYALDGETSLAGVPQLITSMAEFRRMFGGPPGLRFAIAAHQPPSGPSPLSNAGADLPPGLPLAVFNGPGATPKIYELTLTTPAHTLCAAIRHFFLNGGGPAYVNSVGGYGDPISADAILSGLEAVGRTSGPTLLAVPEVTRLSRIEAARVQTAMLAQCEALKDRFALLDMPGGFLDPQSPAGDPVTAFRTDIGDQALDRGAVYYPWLTTNLFSANDFTFENIDPDSRETLIALLKQSKSPVDPKLFDAILGETADAAEGIAADKALRLASPLSWWVRPSPGSRGASWQNARSVDSAGSSTTAKPCAPRPRRPVAVSGAS